MTAVGLFIQMVNFEYVGPAAGGGKWLHCHISKYDRQLMGLCSIIISAFIDLKTTLFGN